MVNYYRGPDRGNEELVDGVNLRLPSGKLLDWGNVDFDVNLIISDAATSQNGQLFFDIFTTDGFLGDLPLVNFAYAPYLNVLPRKYRFRILNACMSRFFQLCIASPNGTAGAVQVHRQRRQLRRQPDHAQHARPSGHRGALRHRRRLLDRSRSAPGSSSSTCSRCATTAAARRTRCRSREALQGDRRRSGDRADAGVPRRRLGAERRRRRRHALLDDAGHQPGAERADRSRSRSSRRCARAWSSSAAPAPATCAGRTASARRIARRTCRSRGPSRSTARMRIR